MKNEVGNRYGKLTVIEFSHVAGREGGKNAYWLCACDCGFTTIVKGTYLRKGHTTSCGCAKKQFFNTKHGHSDIEHLYGVWEQMRSRCNNPNNPRYKSYGGDGITVCDEWNDYGAFRKWAFENGYHDSPPDVPKKDRMSIDRINPSKGYCPENCRWVTVSDNSHFRTKCHANQR